jgi:hypothetical protein
MQQSHDRIAALMTAARETHDAVLSADDALRLAIAQIEHATMAFYWLKIGESFKRLPAKQGSSRPPMSATKSRAARESVLAVLQQTCRSADGVLNDLWEIRRPSKTIERLFGRLKSQMLCVQILAFLIVAVYTSRKPVPKNTLRGMLRDLDAVRLGPDFAERSDSDRDLVWQATAALYGALGDTERLAAALKERRVVTTNSPQEVVRDLVEL